MTQIGLDRAYRLARRIVIGTVGGSILVLGLALLVLPGPAFVVIPIGLSILAIEFAFARRWLRIVAIRTGLKPAEEARSEFEAKWAGVKFQGKRADERENKTEDPAAPSVAGSGRPIADVE